MSKLKKRTQQKENLEVCTKCFASKHIVFNFAYITYDKEFDDKARSTFYNRLLEVSTVPFVTLMTWHKNKGFEDVSIKVNKEIPPQFEKDIQKVDGSYTIIRLYKNNYPTPGRIIGKLVNKVFYIFYIDVKGDLYKH